MVIMLAHAAKAASLLPAAGRLAAVGRDDRQRGSAVDPAGRLRQHEPLLGRQPHERQPLQGCPDAQPAARARKPHVPYVRSAGCRLLSTCCQWLMTGMQQTDACNVMAMSHALQGIRHSQQLRRSQHWGGRPPQPGGDDIDSAAPSSGSGGGRHRQPLFDPFADLPSEPEVSARRTDVSARCTALAVCAASAKIRAEQAAPPDSRSTHVPHQSTLLGGWVMSVQGAAARPSRRPAARQVDETPKSWTIGELIGEGAFGCVYSGLDNDTGRLMAVKQVHFAPAPIDCLTTASNGPVLLSNSAEGAPGRSIQWRQLAAQPVAPTLALPCFCQLPSHTEPARHQPPASNAQDDIVSRAPSAGAAAAQVRVPRAAAVKGKVAVHLSGLEADINVLRRLKHPNIVRYLVRCPVCDSQKG